MQIAESATSEVPTLPPNPEIVLKAELPTPEVESTTHDLQGATEVDTMSMKELIVEDVIKEEVEAKVAGAEAEAKSDVENVGAGTSTAAPFSIKKPEGISLSTLGSLDQIEKVAEARYQEHRELSAQVVTLDQVESIWKSYLAEQSSQTVKAVLDRVQLDVKKQCNRRHSLF